MKPHAVGAPLKLTFAPQSHLPVRVDNYIFANHRDVAGIVVPFRILLMAGRTVVETWDVKEFKVDARSPPRRDAPHPPAFAR